jgi:2-C-methyl-D-erythritol 4-phosphate cytidylyltransferase
MANKAHKIADLLRRMAGKPPAHRHTTAIIAAAGSSTRMGSESSKVLLDIDGMPILARTLLAYQAAGNIDEIVLVARREDFDTFIALAKKHHITKLKRVTPGGDDRQTSVLHGFEVVSDKTEFVAIADAARCLTTPEQIDMVCRTAYRTQAASAATPATDTVKLVDAKGYSKKNSPNRNEVWLAQTPQVFSLPLYRAAAYHAKEKGMTATDDNALAEAIGRRVKLVDCGKENIKITTPDDLYVAKAILERRFDQQINTKEGNNS